jgi:hypothetical protein
MTSWQRRLPCRSRFRACRVKSRLTFGSGCGLPRTARVDSGAASCVFAPTIGHGRVPSRAAVLGRAAAMGAPPVCEPQDRATMTTALRSSLPDDERHAPPEPRLLWCQAQLTHSLLEVLVDLLARDDLDGGGQPLRCSLDLHIVVLQPLHRRACVEAPIGPGGRRAERTSASTGIVSGSRPSHASLSLRVERASERACVHARAGLLCQSVRRGQAGRCAPVQHLPHDGDGAPSHAGMLGLGKLAEFAVQRAPLDLSSRGFSGRAVHGAHRRARTWSPMCAHISTTQGPSSSLLSAACEPRGHTADRHALPT